jgi:hypothetical protein
MVAKHGRDKAGNNDRSRHCEERSDEAIQNREAGLDCFASLAMTGDY